MHAPNPVLLARLQRLVLLATYLNFALNFVTPLLAVWLTESGARGNAEAALILAGAFALSSIGTPWVGRQIDRNRYGWPLALAFFGNLFGVVTLTSGTNVWLLFVGATAILFSSGCVSTLSSHVREGLTPNDRRRAVATQSYVFANFGFATAGVLAIFFLREHRKLLLGLDVASYLLIWAVLWYASHQLREDAVQRKAPVSVASWREILSPRMLEVVFSTLVLFIVMGASWVVMPLLYRTLKLDAGAYSSHTMAVNAVVCSTVGLLLPRLRLSLFARTAGAGLLAGLGLAFQPLISSFTINAVLTILWATGEVLLNAEIIQAYFRDLGPENAGAAAGLRITMQKVAQVICPLIAVTIQPESVTAFALIFGVPSLVAGLALYRILSRPARVEAAPPRARPVRDLPPRPVFGRRPPEVSAP